MNNWLNRCHFGDCLSVLRDMPDGLVQTCVTSPPYFGLRDYGHAGQIGLEPTPDEFIAKLVTVFREVRRVLRDDGTLWLNLGSSYASGDKTPNQSLLRQRVPSCGKRGTAPQGSQGADRACLDSCDEPQGATHCHHESSARTGQSSRQAAQQIEPTTQGSEHSGFDQSSRLTFQTGDHQSTTGATSQNVQDALLLSDEALVCQQEPRTSLRDAQECADKSACTCGTSRMLQPLAVHTKGKESFFSACRRSDCNGIGMCGYCFSSLTTASLNIKQKDELNIPHLVAMALQADGWILRQTICWSKPNPMPESVRDRCTKAHEYVFLLSKSERYFFDSEAMKEPASQPRGEAKKTGQHKSEVFGHSGTLGSNQGAGTRNRRSVWTVSTKPYKGAHFATFPTELIEPCILAGAPAGGIVLDPFFGSGTTGQVAQALGRQFIGIELNDAYKPLQDERLRQPSLLLEAA